MKPGTYTPPERRRNRDITGAVGASPVKRTEVNLSAVFDVGPAPARSPHRNGPRSRRRQAAP